MPNNDEARTPVTPDEIRTIADILSSFSVSSTGLDGYVAQLRQLAEQLPVILTVIRAAEERQAALDAPYKITTSTTYWKRVNEAEIALRSALAALEAK